jgi:hypothetical protein
MTALEVRAGSNASLKPVSQANIAYGTNKSYRLSQLGGPQILIAGPPLPGSGSKNKTPRAHSTEGQSDLGVEKSMGARSRLVRSQSNTFGKLYGIDMLGAAAVDGDILLVRPNGKAIVIGTMTVAAGDSAETVDSPTGLPEGFCLAPGEDIVFVPDTSAEPLQGHVLWIPNFVDTDLISHRFPLTASKATVLKTPPGKVWQLATSEEEAVCNMGILNLDTAVDHPYTAYINDGISDVLYDTDTAIAGEFKQLSNGGSSGFFLPAGHSLKIMLAAAGPDVLFYGTVSEYNQAEVGDEVFATPVIVPDNGPEP